MNGDVRPVAFDKIGSMESSECVDYGIMEINFKRKF